MDRSERFYLIDRLLNERKLVTRREFLDALEVSPATFKRDLEYMRERFNAPIVWNAGPRRLRVRRDARRSEVRAARPVVQPVGDPRAADDGRDAGRAAAGPAVDARRAAARASRDAARGGRRRVERGAQARPHAPAGGADASRERVRDRCRGDAEAPSPAHALRRTQLRADDRPDGVAAAARALPRQLVSRRLVPPARRPAQVRARRDPSRRDLLDDKAKPVDLRTVERQLDSGYGVFGGRDVQWATLRFSPARARWVAHERWHPEQRGRLERRRDATCSTCRSPIRAS